LKRRLAGVFFPCMGFPLLRFCAIIKRKGAAGEPP
jgi:hypothetical protein